MEKHTGTRSVEPAISIIQQPDSVEIEWSNGNETLNFNHSFSDPKLFYQRITTSNQGLLKACSNRQRNILRILDLTGGWGIDSFILAQHGKQVTMLEQNALIHSVVSQSLINARKKSHTKAAAQHIALEQCNSVDYLQALTGEAHFDCIYLDPMFPSHKSGAKPGKEMQILQYLTENFEIESCFDLALQKCGNRVVVKRPIRAATITDLKPDLCYREKTIRFDIYLTTP